VNNLLYSDSSSNTFCVEQVPFSGNLSSIFVNQPMVTGSRAFSALRASSLALIMAFSPVTTGLDPWWNDRRSHENLSQGFVFRPIVRQRVSLLAARKLALEILYQAERERLNAAEEDAWRSAEIEP
jgi:hypothetical protein